MSLTARRTFKTLLVLAVFIVAGLLLRADVPQVPSNVWVAAGDMTSVRAGASATLLPNGLVLVAGGIDVNSATASVERFSPDGAHFIEGQSMQLPRANHTATLLADGRVLVAGGTGASGTADGSAEIYDPSANVWTPAGSLNVARRGHTATRLPDGKVLIAGGDDNGQAIDSLEIFDPATALFTVIEGASSGARTLHAAAALLDGRVLIAGGNDGQNALASTSIYDPGTNAVSAGPNLSTPRSGLSATTLLDGRVLVAGGAGVSGGELASAEIFDPASNAFTATDNSLSFARQNHLAFLLPHNNQVLIVGGLADRSAVAAAEYFTPWEGTNGVFCADTICASGYVGPRQPATARAWAMGSALSFPADKSHRAGPNDGLFMLAGGSGQQSSELFGFATVKTDQEDYAPGRTVTITGSGWKPHEFVALVLREAPFFDEHPLLDVEADDNGNIISEEFVPDEHDIGISFYLTAYGEESQAQTTFRDAGTLSLSPNFGPLGTSVTVGSGGGAFDGNKNNIGIYWDGTLATTSGTLMTTCATNNGGNIQGLCTFAVPASAAGAHTVVATQQDSVGKSVSATFTISAASGDGTMVVSPSSVTASTSGNNFTFTFTAPGADFVAGSSATITVPAGWSAPTTGNTAVAAGSPACTGLTRTISGNTITIAMTCAAGQKFTVTYNGITAPAATGPYTFTTQTRLSGGTLANIASSPVITVNPATVSTTTSVTSSSNPSTYGQSVNFTARVAPGLGSIVPTGSVQFVVDGTNFGAPVLVAACSPSPNACATSGATSTLTAGSHTVSASFVGTGTFTNSSGSLPSQTVNKTTPVVVVTPYTVTYDGGPHSATVTSITGVNGETGATVGTVNLSNTTHTNAGTYNADSWSFTGTANYNNIAATTITDTINKATAAVVVTPYTVTYDGGPHSATVTSITGVNGETGATVGTVNVTNTTHTNVGTYSTDTWSFTGTANYNNIAATTITDTINKATATVVVTPYTVTYDGGPHTATVASITGVNSETGATVGTVDVSNTAHTNAGTYNADSWSFTGTANYSNIAATTITDTINKATASVVVTPYTVTYDGGPHTATVASITGVNSETGATVGTVDVSNTAHTNAGTYNADSWSFTGTGNYSNIAATTITDTINKATATVVVTPYTVTYDGGPHSAAVTSITGVNGETGATVGIVDVSNTTHTNAGTYSTDNWSFTGTANYTNISATTITDTINKATAAVVVTPYTVTYDGGPHSAAVTSITGVNSETGATVGTVNVTNTTHTNAGTYASDSWSFTGTANYNDIAATTITDTINKATAAVVVTPYTVTYDGGAHTATVASITGVNSETGATVGTVDVSNTTHTNAGTYASDSWSFTGAANYNNIAATTITDIINKATATVVVTPYTVTYDGVAHTATVASITGVNTETGATVGTVDVSNTTHTNAGTYASDSWSFTGAANYNNIAATTMTDTINKATAVVVVTPYTVTYDGNSHTATVASITGVNSETGATVGTVDVSNTTHTNAGTYASDSWSFTGTANYHNIAATTITDTINKATAVVVVTPYTVTYDGGAHTATVVSITGVNSETGATVGTVDVSNTTHTNAGTYASDSWSFTGTANYHNIAATTITDTINKADAVIVVTPYHVTYDGNPHTATASATGVESPTPADLTSLLHLGGTTQTNAGDYPNDPWIFDGNTNYKASSGTVHDQIDKALSTTTTIGDGPFTYDGTTHTGGSGTVTGAGGLSASATSVTYSGDQVNAGTYHVTAHYAGDANHLASDGAAVAIVINKATSTTTTIGDGPFTYDSTTHSGGSGTVTGAGGLSASATSVTYTGDQVNAGSYFATAHYAGDANHEASDGLPVAIVINKATSTTTTIGDGPFTYDGTTHAGGSGTVTGAGGLSTSATSVTYSGDQVNAGTYHVTAHYAGDANHLASDGAAVAIVINKATSTTVVTVAGGTTFGYDGLAHPATVSVTGVGGLSLTPAPNYSCGHAPKDVSESGCVASYTFAGDANHTGSSDSKTYTITAAALTVTADDKAITYADAAPAFTVSYAGFVNGETASVLGGSLAFNFAGVPPTSYGPAPVAPNAAGTYRIRPSGLTSTNYAIAFAAGTFVINKATSTTVVTVVGGTTFGYDGLAHPATVSVTGVGGLSLTPAPDYSCGHAPKDVSESGCVASYSYAGDANHTGSSDSKTYTITAAVLTVTADDKAITYADAAPAFTVSYAGFVNGETASVLGGSLAFNFAGVPPTSYGPAPVAPNAAGTYRIRPSGLTSTNYAVAFAAGTFVINKATSTTVVTVVGGTTFGYDGLAHPATVSVTGVGGLSLTPAPDYSCGHAPKDVSESGCVASYSYAGDANHTGSSDSKTYTITAAALTVTADDKAIIYADAAPAFTVSYAGFVNGETASVLGGSLAFNFAGVPPTSYGPAPVAPSAAGTYRIRPSGLTSTNYAVAFAAGTFVINKATSITTTVGGGPFAYDGSTHTGGSGTVTGAGGLNTSATSVSYSGDQINAGSYFVTAHYAGDANHEASDGLPVAIVISKATSTTTTVGDGPFAYDGSTHTGGSGTVTGAGGLNTSATSVTYTGDQINAGSYFVTAHYAGDANHEGSDGLPVAIVISKATSTTTTVGGGPFAYDGSTHTGGSGTVTGAGGLNTNATSVTYSGDQINAGSYFVTAHYAGDANHEGSDGLPVAIVINKATSTTTTLGDGPFSYDGTTHSGGSGTVSGAGGLNTSATSLTYSGDQVNAGTYHVTAHYAGDANHEASDGAAVGILINKATSTTVTAGDGPFTYDGTTHTGGSGTVTGGGALSTSATSLTYSGDQVNAGTYYVTAHYAGDANHEASDGAAVAIVINKATATVLVTPYTVTYDGSPHSASVASITGVNGETGATVGTVTLTTTHTDAGIYNSDTWSFTGAANYNNIAATTITDTINRANAVVTVGGYSGTYDGAAHGATGTATGVGPSANVSSSINFGATFTNVPGGIAHWVFSNPNYFDQSGDVSIAIGKANATITVTGYAATYNGNSHTATGSAQGVEASPANLSALLDLSGTTHTAAGMYNTDGWSFAGNNNYNSANGTVNDVINKANANVIVSPYTVTYDGHAHSATVASIAGVNGETGATVGIVTLNTTHTNAALYTADTWSFTGTANYNSIAATTITDTINKATAVVVVTPYTVTYDGGPHTATVASITGVNGETGATVGTVTLNTTHTNAAIYNADSWSFGGTANYNNITVTTITDTINKASATITVTPYHVPFDSNPHTATGTAKGVLNETLAGLNLGGTTHTPVGDYQTDGWTFTDATGNYNNASGTVRDTIDSWTEQGYFQPVDMTTGSTIIWNTVKGGSTVPLKFKIFAGGIEKTTVAAVTGFSLVPVVCGTGVDAPIDPMDLNTTGGTTLRYDGTSAQFIQNWQTPKPANQCYRAVMTAADGSQIANAFFKTK